MHQANTLRRWGYIAWVLVIAGFAALHAWHLRADFPNGSPWVFDWAKYTDEGWYGSAAARAHLFGNWYLAGDFNTALAAPVWPFVEWMLYFFTGVSIEAARGLAVACFFASLVLSYLLLRAKGTRWMALLALTLSVTSPFLYCFSRLAILEPLQTTLLLATLNVAVRLGRMKRPVVVAGAIGVMVGAIALTKTTGVFLLPAVVWAVAAAMWEKRKTAWQCGFAVGCGMVVTYGAWMALIAWMGLYGEYKYYATINIYPKPPEPYWPLVSLWWSLHGLLWIDHSLVVLAAVLAVAAVVMARSQWGKGLWRDPLFGSSLCAVLGFVLLMAMQDHPQPRYFAVPAFFCFFVVVLVAGALIRESGWMKKAGWSAVALAVSAASIHGLQTIRYAMHPEYTWVNAAEQLTRYIDAHPNGKRLLVSISDDEITLMTRLPSICDDFGTEKLAQKIADHQPGWYASWNDLEPETLEGLHVHYSLEQVATFKALDDPDRNLLVLFKLHPLPGGVIRRPGDPNLRGVLPEDKVDVPVE